MKKKTCSYCGEQLQKGAVFCPYCGKAVNDGGTNRLQPRYRTLLYVIGAVILAEIILTAVIFGVWVKRRAAAAESEGSSIEQSSKQPAGPTPDETAAMPSSTPTTAPEVTEEPTPTSAPTHLPEPTTDPTPTTSPLPTANPVPTATPSALPKPTTDPIPSTLPLPTTDPAPSTAPWPTAGPGPTVIPTSAPTPTAEPVPTETPAPAEDPRRNTENVHVGGIVVLGTYEQDKNFSNGKEEIEWRVLAVEEDRALLLSVYALECLQYNTTDADVTRETCTLRQWLNGDFLNNAFSSVERGRIVDSVLTPDNYPGSGIPQGNETTDKVFFFSSSEVWEYLTGSREISDMIVCRGTAYCYAQGAWKSRGGACDWWVRSPRLYPDYARYVSWAGNIFDDGAVVNENDVAVRPALWLDLRYS